MNDQPETPETPETPEIEPPDNGRRKVTVTLPGGGLTTVDWISRIVIASWLLIALSGSVALLVSLFVLEEIPDLSVVKEIIQILGAPAFGILTYYFTNKGRNGGE